MIGLSNARWVLALCAAAVPAFAEPPPPFVNGAHAAIVDLQMRPPGSEKWGENRLLAHPLGIQKQIFLAHPGGCIVDLKVQFEDGRRLVKRNVNLCKPYVMQEF
jgi:hypothetical protein